jgi:hypothetical protein
VRGKSFPPAVKRWLASPRASGGIILLATLLALPSVTTGLAADDHLHVILMRDDPGLDGYRWQPLDLFNFTGDAAQLRQLMQKGVFPWTTAPELRLTFFRPLASVSHLIDHALWPDTPVLMHAQNLLWFGLLLLVLGILYRCLHVVPWVAGLALLLYAVDDAHGPTFGWIANRHALIAGVFGFAALIAHDRWRRHGETGGRVGGPLLFAGALLAGESALAICGYLVAHAVCLDQGSPRARLRALIPYGLVILVWILVYRLGGFGPRASGTYLNPASDPLGFVAQAGRHLPVLLTGQIAGLWSELFIVLPSGAALVYWIGCVLYLVLFADVVKVVLRASPEARFWGLGMLLAALPICATLPSDRHLIFVGVGAMGLIAVFFHAPEGTPGAASPRAIRRFSVRIWTWGLILAHLVAAVLLLPLRARSMATVSAGLERAYDTLPQDPALPQKTVVAVNPPGDAYMGYLPLMRASRREPIPGRQRWLATGQTAVTVTREDAFTLHVRPAGGYLEQAPEQLVRRLDHPLAAGDRVDLGDVVVEVTTLTPDGRPAASRWRFDRPLEDPALIWLRWGNHPLGFAPFRPPAIGRSVTLPPVDTLRAFLGE